MDNHIANQMGPQGPLLTRLQVIDILSARPLRAIFAAQAASQSPDPFDLAVLAALEAEAEALRASLQP